MSWGLQWRRAPFCCSQAVVIVISRQCSSTDYKMWTSHRNIIYWGPYYWCFSVHMKDHIKKINKTPKDFNFIFTYTQLFGIFTHNSENYCLFWAECYSLEIFITVSCLSILPVVRLHYFLFRFIISNYLYEVQKSCKA